MKVIKQSSEILFKPDNILELIETAGRTCYKSNSSGYPKLFVKGLISRGHHSVIEHVNVTVRFICDRGVSHELVRHRVASFCLSGETIVTAHRRQDASARSQKSWTINKLYKWQDDPKRKGRLKLIRLRSVDADGRIIPGKIKRIIDSGKQITFEIKGRSGRTIRATAKHLMLTDTGWKRVSELSVGSRLVANGLPALENREWLCQKYIIENHTLQEMADLAGCCVTYVTRALRRFGINKPLSMRKNITPGYGHPGMFSDEQRAEISKRMSGENNHRWLGDEAGPLAGRLRARRMYTPDACWACGATEKLERHHANCDPTNNTPENIMFLCQTCHKAFHSGPGVLTVFNDEIVSIKEYGEEQTYDIEMCESPHNFVANGFVVHNSQESTRYANYSSSRFGKQITVIIPVWYERLIQTGAMSNAEIAVLGQQLYDGGTKLHRRAARWLSQCVEAESAYLDMIAAEATPQEARSVLPNSLKTEVVMTANLREWRHVLDLRCSKAAHPQMRNLMMPLFDDFRSMMPEVFETTKKQEK